MAKYKYLTIDERWTIQHMLEKKAPFAEIARKLGRDRMTISKEIRSHLVFKNTLGMLSIYGEPTTDIKGSHPAPKTIAIQMAQTTYLNHVGTGFIDGFVCKINEHRRARYPP